MQVNIKTYKPFTAAVNDLKEKYGEKFIMVFMILNYH